MRIARCIAIVVAASGKYIVIPSLIDSPKINRPNSFGARFVAKSPIGRYIQSAIAAKPEFLARSTRFVGVKFL